MQFVGPRVAVSGGDTVTFNLLDGKKEVEFWVSRASLDRAGASAKRTLRDKFDLLRDDVIARAQRIFKAAESGSRHEITLGDAIRIVGDA